jgi:hypothetical protein
MEGKMYTSTFMFKETLDFLKLKYEPEYGTK